MPDIFENAIIFICCKKVCVRTMIVHTEGKRSRNFFYSLKKYPLKCWFFSFYSSRPGRRNFTNDAATLHNPWGNSWSLGSNHSANEPRISLQPTNTAGMNTILHEAVMDEGRFCRSISLVFMNQSWTHLFTISLKANCYKLRRVLLW